MCDGFILCNNPWARSQISRKQVAEAAGLLVTSGVAAKDNGIMFALRGQVQNPHWVTNQGVLLREQNQCGKQVVALWSIPIIRREPGFLHSLVPDGLRTFCLLYKLLSAQDRKFNKRYNSGAELGSFWIEKESPRRRNEDKMDQEVKSGRREST